jgi:DNA integrity scanning protein DisA with diadenylate cyclase activity
MISYLHEHFPLMLEASRGFIEVLVMAAGIYYLWKLFRGTRGARVLAGFGFLLASLSLLAKVLGLTVIEKLLSVSSTFLVLGLVVIFQPELRRIFAEVGSRPLMGAHRQQTEVIEVVISALEQLQQDGHGALIAFEREITYGPARENGTLIDARVSDDLLTTIFFPKTPLHDGGTVIVQDLPPHPGGGPPAHARPAAPRRPRAQRRDRRRRRRAFRGDRHHFPRHRRRTAPAPYHG